jgi:hypothetical protein
MAWWFPLSPVGLFGWQTRFSRIYLETAALNLQLFFGHRHTESIINVIPDIRAIRQWIALGNVPTQMHETAIRNLIHALVGVCTFSNHGNAPSFGDDEI